MLCHDARRASRVADGELVLLADQDRSLWDRGADRARRRALDRALRALPRPVRAAGRDRVAAARVPRSTGRRSPRSTASWPALTGSPVVELNRAVAIAEAGDAGGARWRSPTRLDARRLPLPALHTRRATAAARPVRARPRRRTGARSALGPTEPERRFLARRLSARAPTETGLSLSASAEALSGPESLRVVPAGSWRASRCWGHARARLSRF